MNKKSKVIGGNAVGGGGYSNDFESATLFQYGLTNKFNAQILIGVDEYQGGTGVPSQNGLEVNTARIRLPYKLHSYKQGQWGPTLRLFLESTHRLHPARLDSGRRLLGNSSFLDAGRTHSPHPRQ